jgi:hypothetical protein
MTSLPELAAVALESQPADTRSMVEWHFLDGESVVKIQRPCTRSAVMS